MALCGQLKTKYVHGLSGGMADHGTPELDTGVGSFPVDTYRWGSIHLDLFSPYPVGVKWQEGAYVDITEDLQICQHSQYDLMSTQQCIL